MNCKLLFSENPGSEPGYKIVRNACTCSEHLLQNANGVFPGDPPDFECKFQNTKSAGIGNPESFSNLPCKSVIRQQNCASESCNRQSPEFSGPQSRIPLT